MKYIIPSKFYLSSKTPQCTSSEQEAAAPFLFMYEGGCYFVFLGFFAFGPSLPSSNKGEPYLSISTFPLGAGTNSS